MKDMIKIPKKSKEEIEKEITDILKGKGHGQREIMLRMASKSLRVFNTQEEVIKLFVDEYIKKYGQLESGEKTLEQIKQEAIKDTATAKRLGKV